jgi:hypothetical protein
LNPSKDKFPATLVTRDHSKLLMFPNVNNWLKSKFLVREKAINLVTIGYAGYIVGIKSENVFGSTFGKSTYASAAKSFHNGIDEPPHLKYTTTMKS